MNSKQQKQQTDTEKYLALNDTEKRSRLNEICWQCMNRFGLENQTLTMKEEYHAWFRECYVFCFEMAKHNPEMMRDCIRSFIDTNKDKELAILYKFATAFGCIAGYYVKEQCKRPKYNWETVVEYIDSVVGLDI